MERKTYLEVEPDAEYYLHVRKVDNDGMTQGCKFCIDGQDLGYYVFFGGDAQVQR